jgi:transmembrane sensor
MKQSDNSQGTADFPSSLEQAAAAYIRQHSGEWTALEQAQFETWLGGPGHLDAYRHVQQAWKTVGQHAASPKLLAFRADAIRRARRDKQARWWQGSRGFHVKWVAAVTIMLLLGLALKLWFSGVREIDYRTGNGEQRLIELADGSRVALDARTTLRVRMTRDARVVELLNGQAQFMVAHDRRRPFLVEAGRDTIIAVGTSFNVEYFDSHVDVAMVTGQVVVTLGTPAADLANGGAAQPLAAPAIDHTVNLTAGDELSIGPNGQAVIAHGADVTAAIAWRQGKIVFNNTPLNEAVRRLNRYSTLQIEISDSSLAQQRISGVFEMGDSIAFAQAAQSLLPLVARHNGPDLLVLSPAP